MEISSTGNIKDISLVKMLGYLNRNRKTGTFSLKTSAFTKKAYINQGDAIFASSTYEDDRLGEMLLRSGKITVEQYDKSVELLKSSNKRQGAILVELGYLTPKDLFWGVKYQVKEIIHSMFQIEEGEYEFKEGNIPTEEVITLKMSMGNLIYEGVQKMQNWTAIKNQIPESDSVLKLSDDPLSLFQDIDLSAEDKKIISLIDGRRTIKEIIDSSVTGSFEALKILYILWSIGMIEQASTIPSKTETDKDIKEGTEETISLEDILTPPSEESKEDETFLKRVDSIYTQLDSLSMIELLEVEEKSDSETIRKNYYRLAKEFHPDRYFTSTDKKKFTAIFDALTKAYNTLKDDKLREEYFKSFVSRQKPIKSTEQIDVEGQFRRGIEEFKMGNYWGAVDKFKWAVKMNPKSANYWNCLSLAYSKIPTRLKDAEETILTAIKLEPFHADYYANLGLIYIKAGIRKRAVSNFQKALKIDPKNGKAKKGLQHTRVKK